MNDKSGKIERGWVFLSHSHKDVDLVRKIRNKFEELGFEPLMFYLKCLSDKDEIEGLIKREIAERDWFVYLDSPNARSSTWVKTEREYIEKFKDKKIFTIDLLSDISTQFDIICHIANQMKVFISHSCQDRVLCERLKAKLLEKDMLVSSYENISAGSNITEIMNQNTNDASHSGFVIVLITEQSYKSEFVFREIHQTIANRGKLIPIYVGNVTLPDERRKLFGEIQGIHIAQKPTEEELNNLVQSMMSRVEHYHSR